MLKKIDQQNRLTSNYDIVICGGGVAGLWLLNLLHKAGFDVLLIEKYSLGGTQTMASQGMIHGGQRYTLGGNLSSHAASVATLPDRWDACLEGQGELDLTGVRVLSETQVMWSAGGRLAHLALNVGKHTIKAKMRKLGVHEVPEALAGLNVFPIYELPEKVLDVGSLVDVLSAPHKSRIRKACIESLTRGGSLTVSGGEIKAKIVICAAGLGNEEFLTLLDAGNSTSQRRPLRQFMVKTMPVALYGHGITTSYKPRVTVTSYPLQTGGYVWYIGGALSDETVALTDDAAIAFAKKEMVAIFGHFDWASKQWATWCGVRSEAYSQNGRLPTGPVMQEYDTALVVWPTKLTLTPLLGDLVLARLAEKGVLPRKSVPASKTFEPIPLPQALPPWEQADWI